ncbi:SidE phosphodiesterase domain-containing protein [Legionella longbeachae]|uniref:SidE phosphodiesterase domain-containing protein n=1 Tax=Legionella longbeachae TaxID=450 RepID=UPI001244A70F|nr:SidE phosphodiesterase domain-containing protein [Legionella longbeachae]QEY50411.1 septation initiation protein [Legionella longbeachae]
MPKYVKGVELTQDGMRAIFERMGKDITSGIIYNGNPDIRVDVLNQQGFMPILTGVSPTQESGHWIMLIKGQDNNYYLFDPLGEGSGNGYKNILSRKLPQDATLSVIPNGSGYNMGLCGYWVASAGVRAHTALTGDNPPTLENLGQTITQGMQQELDGNGYAEITGWLQAVANELPAGEAQTDATALRHFTEKELHLRVLPQSNITGKENTTLEITSTPTVNTGPYLPPWNGFSLYTDSTVRDAVKYAFNNYLGKKYTGTVEAIPAQMGRNGDKTVNRPIHGLAHTLRTMAYAEVMVEEARKAKFRGESLRTFKDKRTIADVTPDELKKIMIAQAFFVTGRDDEESANNYARYHEQSRDAFLKYVRENESLLIPHVFNNQDDVNFYANVIEDKDHKWENSPAHVLVNKGHMVDLMRVKQPAESYLESYFKSLQPWIGTIGAEAVFAKQRKFFHATYEMVSSFDCNNPEPHLVTSTNKFRYVLDKKGDPIREAPKEGEKKGKIKFFPPSYKLKENEKFKFGNGGLGRYVIGEDGQPIRNKPAKGETQGTLAFFPTSYQLQDNERWMRIDEYLQLEEVQRKFPGSNKKLERGLPELSEYAYLQHTNSDERAQCENDVDFCLGQLQAANHQSKIAPLKGAIQLSNKLVRRNANVDEIVASRIIQQILADPDVIHNDHVLLNGQRLEEPFFRDLLAKCDMAIVGSLLNSTDIKNIDRLMKHEIDTEFHPTDPNEPAKKIGETWENTIRKGGGVLQIETDLIFLMQNDAWYYSRVNAIAQNRDKGSTFKEVLITALMTPLTRKSLVDTDMSPSPQTLFRGLNLSEEFKNKLINQTHKIIANTTEHLFTDPSAEIFKQIKLNDYSHISARTNASSSTNIAVPRDMFDSNTIIEMIDPDGLLQPKQVGTHIEGSESEYSIYLPEDIALIPIKLTIDGQTAKGNDRHIFTCVAVQSADFTPQHQNGFALLPFIKMQTTTLSRVIDDVNTEAEGSLNERLKSLRLKMVEQSHLPVRGGFLDKILHYFSGKDDKKISLERKNFLNQKVIPLLQECHIALRLNNVEMMQRALTKFPTDKEWSHFKSDVAKAAKMEMDNLRPLIEKKIALQNQLLPLIKCQDALEKQQITEAIKALENIPSDNEMSNMPWISSNIREQIQSAKQAVTENLAPIQHVVKMPALTNAEHVRKRYDALLINITRKIADQDTVTLSGLANVKKEIAHFDALQEEIKLLRHEKALLHYGDKAIDFADIEKLEEQLHVLHNKLCDAYVLQITKGIDILEHKKPKNLVDVKKNISRFYEQLAEVNQLHQEKIKKHETFKDPLEHSDIDGLKTRLQQMNQRLIKILISNIKVSLNQMEAITFDEQKKEAQQNLQLLDKLAKTLDDSDTAQEQKIEIVKLNDFFMEKQKAYPAMTQLQFKIEALIIQLRELCELHQATSRKRSEELSKNRSMFQAITDFIGLTTDERVALAKKGKKLEQLKKGINNDTYDIKQLLNHLTKKSADELEEAFGMSTESAKKLYELLKHLNRNTTFAAKIKERTELIDTVLAELSKTSMQFALTQANPEISDEESVEFDYLIL